MADEEIVVNVEDGAAGGGDIAVHQDDAVAEFKRMYDEQIAINKRDKDAADAANRRATEASQEAGRLRQEVQTARSEVADRELDTIVQGIAAAEAEAEAAEKDYALAAETGDFKKQAEAQRRIAKAESRIGRLDEAKSDLEARKAAPRTEDPPARSSADPFEQHLTKFTPRTADWMREHRDWVTDSRKSAKLTGAHHMAVGDGLTPDTDEYFEAVEKTLGLRDQRDGSTNGQTRTTARRSAPPVAPVNGGAGAHSSGASDNRGSNQVRLTKGEANRATDGTLVWNPGARHPKTGEPIKHGDPLVGKPIGTYEMARRKQEGERQGLYDKNAIEA